MTRVVLVCLALVTVFSFSSCKKCATCTFNDPRPEIGLLEEEFCGRGKVYEDQLNIYQARNWRCVED